MLIHRLSKGLEGNVCFKGDYYFEDEPKTNNMLLKLSDSNLTDNTVGVFLDLKTRKKNSNTTCLEVDNCGNVTLLPDVTFEQGKWYNIKVDVDNLKRDYVIYIDDKEVQTGHITAAATEKEGFGVISYRILTPRGNFQTLVLDNLEIRVCKKLLII